MIETLQQLRERPKEEKRTIAATVSIGVVAILFIGWVVYFFHSFGSTQPLTIKNTGGPIDASGFEQAGQQLQQAYGSSTQFVESATGTIELQEVSSTSEPSL